MKNERTLYDPDGNAHEWDPNDDVYYRPCIDDDGKPYVACLQWFDEYGRDQSRNMNDERYFSEEEAWQAIEVMRVQAMRDLGILSSHVEAAKQALALRVLGITTRK